MNSKNVFFELIKTHKEARLGQIRTSRGLIDTPAFMPVGTQGTVKSIFVDDIIKTNSQIILGNTYHLFLRPGLEILKNIFRSARVSHLGSRPPMCALWMISHSVFNQVKRSV